jgi:rhamnogalacturonyl hydrolase YesR
MDESPPELLLLAREPQDDLNLMCLKALLVERGVHFAFDDDDRLPERLPENLGRVRTLLAEEDLASGWSDPEKRRVAEFRSAGGYFRTFKRYGRVREILRTNPGWREEMAPTEIGAISTFCNVPIDHLVRDVLVNAGVRRDHPALARRLGARSDGDAVRRALKTFETYREELCGWDDRSAWPWRMLEEMEDLEPGKGFRAKADALIERAMAHSPNVGGNMDRVVGMQSVLRRFEETRDPRYLEYARSRLADRVVAKFPRIEGAVVMGPERDRCLWVDTLHGFPASAACLGRVTGERRFLDEAVNQVRTVARMNQDADGVFYHGSRPGGERLGVKWCRGNGWAMTGIAETLRHFPKGDPFLAEGGEILRKAGEGLAALQDPATGLWRNHMTHPLSRFEGSGSGLIVYGLATGLHRGWFRSRAVEACVAKAWRGLKARLFDGWVMTQAIGTGVGPDDYYYLNRPQHHGRPNQFLLASTAIRRLGGEGPRP